MMRYHWPGNVRELQNVIEHTAVLVRPGGTIEPEDVPEFEKGQDGLLNTEFAGATISMFASGGYHEARDRVLARFERDYLGWVLQHADGNMSEAARVAGVDRTTLYRLMGKHGLEKAELLDD